jgi:hypothetical protein
VVEREGIDVVASGILDGQKGRRRSRSLYVCRTEYEDGDEDDRRRTTTRTRQMIQPAAVCGPQKGRRTRTTAIIVYL